MVKKILAAILGITLLGGAGLMTAGIMRANSSRQSFSTDGYVLQGELGEVKQIAFQADASYAVSRAGFVSFEDIEGVKAAVRQESFVWLNDGSVMALSDGILLDFNDLSENFINNYYITAGLPILGADGAYRFRHYRVRRKFVEAVRR